ncbi:MAG: hypothetical protein D6755_10735 [Anaerolineae bacterium]|nr:MAG: hypothetical protein D6755_10735 [Anaerolineae bacterium]
MTWLSILAQSQGPAETTGYMVFGYAVIFVVMFLYLGSLMLRKRNLEQDITLLESLEKEQ